MNEQKIKKNKDFALWVKILVIVGIVVSAFLISRIISNFFGIETQFGGVKLPATEIVVFHPGLPILSGKVYKLFEIPMSEDQGTNLLVGGNVIDGIFYTPCNYNYQSVFCGSFDLAKLKFELFDFSGFKERIKSNVPDYLVNQFVRDHATNLITESGVIDDSNIKIDYRTDNYDFSINCDPFIQTPRTTYRSSSVRKDCIIIKKRNGIFANGKDSQVIITRDWQPQGFTFLEKSLIWQRYNKEIGKTEYFIYNIE